MSFSSEVKEEMAKQIGNARHCQIAELAAILSYCGSIRRSESGRDELVISVDRESLYRKCFTLLKKTYNIKSVFDCADTIKVGTNGKYEIVLDDEATVWNILKGTCIVDKDGAFKGFGGVIDSTLIKNSCCRSAYLRGVFICIGSISDPSKGYHLEMVCEDEDNAKQIVRIISTFDLEAKIVCRKRYYVVYIKEGSTIVDFLGVCGAVASLLELENLRVYREVSNSINRQVNCEAANIAKTIKAANRQVEDILLIQRVYGFDKLPDNLREMAEVRLEYPDASLQELGELLDPPVGKSGVNHRLRKLSELAAEFR